MPRRDVVAAVVAVLVAAACVRLGIWQLDRLSQRRSLNASLAALQALPPLELRDRSMSLDAARERRIVARGVYDFAAERTWPGRSFEGTPGVALITPLRLPDGSAVLVDRGWVPSPDAFHVDHGAYREPDTATITGIARVPPRGRGDVDTTGFLPFIIEVQTAEPARGLPRRWPPPSFGNGPHLSYAIQWFSFALIVLVGTAAMIRKGR
ncbi:MAG TPA: SURF1 family protein [Gemmatimonadales bacterium]|nr:SURF1 family protein [Gemmatimonadales bacterium]